jgi:hypothetical protein
VLGPIVEKERLASDGINHNHNVNSIQKDDN